MENERMTPRAASAGENGGQAGFTLLELLVSVAIFVIVTGSIYSLLAVGRNDGFRVKQRTEVMQQLRVAMNAIGRDAINAGVGYPNEGAQVQDGLLNALLDTVVAIPGVTDGEPDLLTPVVPYNNVNWNDVPTNNARRTDQISFIYRDNTFANNQPVPIQQSGSGASFVVQGGYSNSIFDEGGLYVITGTGGAAIGMVTQIPGGNRIVFSNSDPLDLNQPGSNGPLTDALEGNPGTIYRMNMITYYVAENGTLIRRRYGTPPASILGNGFTNPDDGFLEEPLASGVEDMQIRYVLKDGTVTDLPTDNTNIRMLRVRIVARAPELDIQTKQPIRYTLENTFSTRNMVYSTKKF